MIVMVSNQTGRVVHYLAGRFPGKIGHLFSPDGWRKPSPWIPYALDNGCFKRWDPEGFEAHLERARLSGQRPLWCVVPDAVGDREETLRRWPEWAPRVKASGFATAFAAQDGMSPGDVPAEAEIVFMGGTTEWKWRNVETFATAFPRLHVGRVNEERALWLCHDLGVESVDGTGWYHYRQLEGLKNYLRATAGETRRHEQIPLSEVVA